MNFQSKEASYHLVDSWCQKTHSSLPLFPLYVSIILISILCCAFMCLKRQAFGHLLRITSHKSHLFPRLSAQARFLFVNRSFSARLVFLTFLSMANFWFPFHSSGTWICELVAFWNHKQFPQKAKPATQKLQDGEICFCRFGLCAEKARNAKIKKLKENNQLSWFLEWLCKWIK